MEPWFKWCGKNRAGTQLELPVSWMVPCNHVHASCTVLVNFPHMKFPRKRPNYLHHAKWFAQKKGLGFESSGAQGGRGCPPGSMIVTRISRIK